MKRIYCFFFGHKKLMLMKSSSKFQFSETLVLASNDNPDFISIGVPPKAVVNICSRCGSLYSRLVQEEGE